MADTEAGGSSLGKALRLAFPAHRAGGSAAAGAQSSSSLLPPRAVSSGDGDSAPWPLAAGRDAPIPGASTRLMAGLWEGTKKSKTSKMTLLTIDSMGKRFHKPASISERLRKEGHYFV